MRVKFDSQRYFNWQSEATSKTVREYEQKYQQVSGRPITVTAMIAMFKYGKGMPFYKNHWVFRCHPRPNGT